MEGFSEKVIEHIILKEYFKDWAFLVSTIFHILASGGFHEIFLIYKNYFI